MLRVDKGIRSGEDTLMPKLACFTRMAVPEALSTKLQDRIHGARTNSTGKLGVCCCVLA